MTIPSNIQEQKVSELRKIASQLDIKNPSRLKKPLLIEAIQEKLAEQGKKAIVVDKINNDKSCEFGPHNPNFQEDFKALNEKNRTAAPKAVVVEAPEMKEDVSEEKETDLNKFISYIRGLTEKFAKPRADSKAESILAHLLLSDNKTGSSKYKIAKMMNTYYSVVSGVEQRYGYIVKEYEA